MGETDGTTNFEWVADFDGDLASPTGGRGKRKSKQRKKKFAGWGSAQLIQFLQSIGKMTSEPLSQFDVTSIINQYVSENNLVQPSKKRRVQCDERLYTLFGKKSIGKIKIHDLLEPHFAENQDVSEDSVMRSSDEGENLCSGNKSKQVSSSCGKTLSKTKVFEVPKSCFAAVRPENMRLVYLRRSLVQDLLKDPDGFQRKVVGSFVRVKSDPLDYLQKNSHQLQLVKSVKMVTAAGNNVLLEISDMAKNVKIQELSEDDFSEAECNDLSQKIKDGIFKKLTVVDLLQKAQLLHKDVTKHWLAREISRLGKLVDRANEKGWRREMFEYRETKKRLETPSEQERLFQEIPEIIAEELRIEDISAVLEPHTEEEAVNPPTPMDSADTTLAMHQIDWAETTPPVPHFDWLETPAVDHLGEKHKDNASRSTHKEEAVNPPTPMDSADTAPAMHQIDWAETTPPVPHFDWVEIPAVDHLGEKYNDNASMSTYKMDLNGSRSFGVLGTSTSSYLKAQELVKEEVTANGISLYTTEANSNIQPHPPLTKSISYQAAGSAKTKLPEIIDIDAACSDRSHLSDQKVSTSHKAAGSIKEPVIITIDDDDEAGDTSNSTSPDDQVWLYKDPNGVTQGPFNLTILRRWHERNYFRPDFQVWKASQSSKEAVLLNEVVYQMFPPSKA